MLSRLYKQQRLYNNWLVTYTKIADLDIKVTHIDYCLNTIKPGKAHQNHIVLIMCKLSNYSLNFTPYTLYPELKSYKVLKLYASTISHNYIKP